MRRGRRGHRLVGYPALAARPLLVQLPALYRTGLNDHRHDVGGGVLRGTGTWTAYFDLGGFPGCRPAGPWSPRLPPSWRRAAAAAAGLAGLARRDMPERRWLCICAGLVAAITLAGYYGPLGGPLHAAVDSLLNGPLAPFRSTYKFEPVLAW